MFDDSAPYKYPIYPFFLNEDGDICDVNGWLVCCPAKEVWGKYDDKTYAQDILKLLNKTVAFHD